MLPEFETGVTGMSEGETKDVPLNFPEDYHGKDVAGKQAVFAITLKMSPSRNFRKWTPILPRTWRHRRRRGQDA